MLVGECFAPESGLRPWALGSGVFVGGFGAGLWALCVECGVSVSVPG